MKVKEILSFIFGKRPGVRYRRMMYLVILVFVFIMMIQNVGCGINEDGEYYFNWKPAAEIKIEK